MSKDNATKRAPVLDPAERASEIIFGVIMAVSFTGTLSVATAGGPQEVRTMAMAAFGSSLAWGLTDAVMYLIDTATRRNRVVALLRRVRATPDAAEADALIAGELPERLAEPKVLEAIRVHLPNLPEPPAGLGVDDYLGAVGVALLVVAATLPIVIPFYLTDDVWLAMRLSNGVALVTLFVSGCVLGRYASGNPWRSGAAMVAVGAALVATIMALGG